MAWTAWPGMKASLGGGVGLNWSGSLGWRYEWVSVLRCQGLLLFSGSAWVCCSMLCYGSNEESLDFLHYFMVSCGFGFG